MKWCRPIARWHIFMFASKLVYLLCCYCYIRSPDAFIDERMPANCYMIFLFTWKLVHFLSCCYIYDGPQLFCVLLTYVLNDAFQLSNMSNCLLLFFVFLGICWSNTLCREQNMYFLLLFCCGIKIIPLYRIGFIDLIQLVFLRIFHN
jgi:hypothetical protein